MTNPDEPFSLNTLNIELNDEDLIKRLSQDFAVLIDSAKTRFGKKGVDILLKILLKKMCGNETIPYDSVRNIFNQAMVSIALDKNTGSKRKSRAARWLGINRGTFNKYNKEGLL